MLNHFYKLTAFKGKFKSHVEYHNFPIANGREAFLRTLYSNEKHFLLEIVAIFKDKISDIFADESLRKKIPKDLIPTVDLTVELPKTETVQNYIDSKISELVEFIEDLSSLGWTSTTEKRLSNALETLSSKTSYNPILDKLIEFTDDEFRAVFVEVIGYDLFSGHSELYGVIKDACVQAFLDLDFAPIYYVRNTKYHSWYKLNAQFIGKIAPLLNDAQAVQFAYIKKYSFLGLREMLLIKYEDLPAGFKQVLIDAEINIDDAKGWIKFQALFGIEYNGEMDIIQNENFQQWWDNYQNSNSQFSQFRKFIDFLKITKGYPK